MPIILNPFTHRFKNIPAQWLPSRTGLYHFALYPDMALCQHRPRKPPWAAGTEAVEQPPPGASICKRCLAILERDAEFRHEEPPQANASVSLPQPRHESLPPDKVKLPKPSPTPPRAADFHPRRKK